MATDAAAGDGWFKIWDEGYDEDSQQWCTEKLIANNGLLSASLPGGIPTGYYLVRPELLALHEADKGDPQFYVGCAQLFVKGTVQGSLEIPEQYQASIPGYVSATDESVTFNIYANPMALPYQIPGPEPFSPTADAAPERRAAEDVQTQGIVPQDCLLKNANWCGVEVNAYSDQDGCWAASKNCFKQQADCYNSAPPTGSKGCAVWGDKCTTVQNACNAGDWNGPPDAGQPLGEVSADVPGPIPPAAPTATGATAPAVQETGASDANGAIVPSQTSGAVASGTETSVPSATPSDTTSSDDSGSSDPDSDSGDNTDDDSSGGDGNSGVYESGKDDAAPGDDSSSSSVSQDGACGGNAMSCEGSAFGSCCSASGRCGSSRMHCGCGCQSAFGSCNKSKSLER
jgi:hypothetical protein